MKKYFTRYFVETSEIVVGDTVKNHLFEVAIVTNIKNVPWGFNYDLQIISNSVFNNVGDRIEAKKEHLTKLSRLILCERKRDQDTLITKEIGPVSKEAIWVGEGDEFDEEEIKIVMGKKFECTCELLKINKPHCEHDVDDHHGGTMCIREIDIVRCVEILCPSTKKHFH